MARKKPIYDCQMCGTPGAVSVPCGFCKVKAGGKKQSHMFCDVCFLKGCPVVYPSKFVDFWAKYALMLVENI